MEAESFYSSPYDPAYPDHTCLLESTEDLVLSSGIGMKQWMCFFLAGNVFILFYFVVLWNVFLLFGDAPCCYLMMSHVLSGWLNK